MTTEKTRTVTFVKQENLWFPLLDNDTIDQRGPGYKSQKAVREWAAHRAEMTGEKIVVQFRK